MIDNRSSATRAVIYRDNLIYNINSIKSILNERTMICAAVKADGYGHGAVEVARTVLENGILCLGVSSAGEGGELRRAGIDASILLYSHADLREIDDLCKWNIEPFAGSIKYLKQLEAGAEKQKTVLQIHLKIDTGMGRIGCRPEEAPELAAYIVKSPLLELKGTCTHFPVADGISREDMDFTENQISVFRNTVQKIRDAGFDPGIVHAGNSAVTTSWPEAHFDMVRPGIILYGYYPAPDMKKTIDVKPVMGLETSIVNIKKIRTGESVSYGRTWKAEEETIIGTISAGYGDGYSRLLSNRAEVFIEGKRYPQAGRICMDQCMVDLGPEGDHPDLNDRVVLFGPEEGAPDAEELAIIIGTIPYEITCGINPRVPRIYV